MKKTKLMTTYESATLLNAMAVHWYSRPEQNLPPIIWPYPPYLMAVKIT